MAVWFTGDVFDAFGFDYLNELVLGLGFVDCRAHGRLKTSA